MTFPKGDDDDDDENDRKPSADELREQEEVLGSFYNLLLQGAPPQRDSGDSMDYIDVQKASNVLEAAAGNLALAANLYWDDYFASQAAMPEDRKSDPREKKRAAENEDDRKPAAGVARYRRDANWNDEELSEGIHKKRRLRRSLDRDFLAADDDEGTKQRKKASKRARKSTRKQEGPNEGRAAEERSQEEDHNMDAEANHDERPFRPRQREEPQRIMAHHASETSNSVSDDEKASPHRKYQGKRPREHKSGKARVAVSKSAVMQALHAIHRKIDPNKTQLSKPSTWFLSPDQGKRRKRKTWEGKNACDESSVDSNPDDYISDDDWLEGDTGAPTPSLWGVPPIIEPLVVPDRAVSAPQPPPLPAIGRVRNNNEEYEEVEPNGNVVAADDDIMNVSGGEDDTSHSNNLPESEPTIATGIPHTWLHAGFQLSDCGSGLVISSPTIDDIPFFSWRRQQDNNEQRNEVPPPYHCKALTTITSIVTALLYTGASIEGQEANCTAGKVPWASLSLEDRKREFEARLADALSALIFVAAKASQQRKQKAYRKALRAFQKRTVDPTNEYSDLLKEAIAERKASLAAEERKEYSEDVETNESDQKKPAAIEEDSNGLETGKKAISEEKLDPTSREWMEHMRRHVQLIPTCTWADSKNATAPRAGDGPLYNKNSNLKTSWTNIRDISLYVRSNMRAFTDKGGIALLLETLVRIHGSKVIARQLSRARGTPLDSKSSSMDKDGFSNGEDAMNIDKFSTSLSCSLIHCNCESRQKQALEERPLPLNVRTDSTKLLDVTPDGTECASVELLTLILTGRIHSDWKDVSTEGLGIGLLAPLGLDIHQALTRPKKPVWLLQGPTCCSVATIQGPWYSDRKSPIGPKDSLTTISRVDQPGVSLRLLHWNGWYGQKASTEFRLVAARFVDSIPSEERRAAQFPSRKVPTTRPKKITASLLMERRKNEHIIASVSSKEHSFHRDQLAKDQIDPHELEGIRICEEDQKLYPQNHKLWRFRFCLGTTANASQESKVGAWTPYYRLTSRQKRLVETKLGPKINTLLWTRWPGAVIDHFEPEGNPVV